MPRKTKTLEPRPAGPSPSPRSKRRPSAFLDTRVIYCGDCLDKLRQMPPACVDLVYIDPPFNSNRNYEVFWGETKEKRAFEDRHASTQAYIDYMRPRCVELARVLKPTGSFYYHCDWHASHYVKIMLDQIFGENQFQNEIVWKRTSAHSSAKRYGAVHDTIFFYSQSDHYTWNQQFQPFDATYLDAFYTHSDADGRRWRRSDLTGDGIRQGDSGRPWRGIDVTSKGRHWAVPGDACAKLGIRDGTVQDRLDALDAANRIHWPRKRGGVPQFKRYADEMPGVPLQTVWDDIPPLHNLAPERLGYPTQKPLALLERILAVSSNENDIVLDAFCGCGTALVAAQKFKRQWIGIDISPTACRVMAKRMRDICALPEDDSLARIGRGFVVRDLPWTTEKLRAIPPFEFENWAVIALGGIPNKAQVGDRGIDGRIFPLSAVAEARDQWGREGELNLSANWYPIQVKQKDRVGSPDIRDFAGVLAREKRPKGFFVAFDYTDDALQEIDAQFRATGTVVVALTVNDILNEQLARKLS